MYLYTPYIIADVAEEVSDIYQVVCVFHIW